MHIIIFYQAESVDRYSVQTQGHYFILKRTWAIDRTQHENFKLMAILLNNSI